MARDSFIFYRSFYEAIEDIDTESQLELYNAICRKSLYDEDIELHGIAGTLYKLIKPQLDANTERYKNGAKGGRPKKETIGFEEEKTIGFEIEKPNKNNNENVNVNVNDNNIASEDKSSTATAKASKHKYGNYKHVLLKDEELQSLKDTYSNWKDLINYLDEYIEMKGYKAKSHYLCIKKWVVDAVKKQGGYKPKKENFEQRDYGDLSYLYANKGE